MNDEKFYYRVMADDEVDEKKSECARRIIEGFRKICKERTGIDLPDFKLKWVTAASKKNFEEDQIYHQLVKNIQKLAGQGQSGKALPEKYRKDSQQILGLFRAKIFGDEITVYLHHDQSLIDLKTTLAHELLHLFYYQINRQNPLMLTATQESELLAERFEEKILRLLKE